MSFISEIKTILAAVSAISTACSGGIYTLEDTSHTGINRTNTPNAFSSGKILPCILIRGRNVMPTDQLTDTTPLQSAKQTIEIYIHQEIGFATIETISDLVFRALHLKSLTTGQIYWEQSITGQRDFNLDCSYERCDYTVYFVRS